MNVKEKAPTFKTGDAVVLRGISSPPMMVKCVVDAKASAAVGEAIGVHVQWFDKSDNLHEGLFRKEQLEAFSGYR